MKKIALAFMSTLAVMTLSIAPTGLAHAADNAPGGNSPGLNSCLSNCAIDFYLCANIFGSSTTLMRQCRQNYFSCRYTCIVDDNLGGGGGVFAP